MVHRRMRETLKRVARHVARSPLKKGLYPLANALLTGVGKLNARGYDLRKTILVVCPGRSGSTWLAEIVSSLEGYVVLWEPLHLENNPRCKEARFDWQNYFGNGQELGLQKEYLEKLYTGQDLSTRTLTSLEFAPRQLLNIEGYVVKHVNANMILPQITEWFPVRAVLMIRHPCAVVSSQLKHGAWGHLDKESITIPDGLFADFPHLERVFCGLDELEELLAFEWAVQAHVPLSQPTPHPWYLTTYERLVAGGEKEVERIFEYLGERCPRAAKAHLGKPSATAGKEAAVRQNESRLEGWTKHLNADQVTRILDTVHACGVECYDASMTPHEEALPLRPDQPQLFRS